MRDHQQTDQGDKDSRKNLKNRLEDIHIDEELDEEDLVSVEKIKEVLKQSADMAPGPDGVQYSHFTDLDEKGVEQLCQTLNSIQVGKCLMTGYIAI